MAYLFIPPVIDQGPMGGNYLFYRYTRKQGITVFNIGDNWYEEQFPSQDDLDISNVFYLGGHEYYITEAEKDDLEDAGYEVITT